MHFLIGIGNTQSWTQHANWKALMSQQQERWSIYPPVVGFTMSTACFNVGWRFIS